MSETDTKQPQLSRRALIEARLHSAVTFLRTEHGDRLHKDDAEELYEALMELIEFKARLP